MFYFEILGPGLEGLVLSPTSARKMVPLRTHVLESLLPFFIASTCCGQKTKTSSRVDISNTALVTGYRADGCLQATRQLVRFESCPRKNRSTFFAPDFAQSRLIFFLGKVLSFLVFVFVTSGEDIKWRPNSFATCRSRIK